MAVSLHVSSDSTLFFLCLFVFSHGLRGAAVPCNQNAVVWLIAAGIASFRFLHFNHLLMTSAIPVPATVFLPAKRQRLIETYRGFVFPHITCLQEV